MKQIQWFPGHMAKARRQIQEKLELIDIVFELLDARIPYSSANPMLNQIIKRMPKLVILNKADLADPSILNEWVEYFKEKEIASIKVDSVNGKGVDQIVSAANVVLEEKIARSRKRGIVNKPIRALIIGIPNVGKSTFINRLAGRKATRTGDRPGVTKHQQYIKVGDDLELLDTPGILWPKFDDDNVALNLALVGSIKDNILPKDDVVIYGMKYFDKYYKGRIEKRYDIVFDIEDIMSLYEGIGKRRGCLIKGGEIDYDKVNDIFLYDLRHEKLGKVTFDKINV